MPKFTVEIYAVDFCGFSEHYEVEAENEDFAEDIALEKYEEEFADMYGLTMTEHGYAESEDIDDEGECDEDECTTLSTRVVL